MYSVEKIPWLSTLLCFVWASRVVLAQETTTWSVYQFADMDGLFVQIRDAGRYAVTFDTTARRLGYFQLFGLLDMFVSETNTTTGLLVDPEGVRRHKEYGFFPIDCHKPFPNSHLRYNSGD